MSEESKAGELILSQLGMFNEASVLFANIVEPAFLEGIDACVESFAGDSEWKGECDFHIDDGSCWFAPKSWMTNQDEDKPEFKARFEIDSIDGDSDYWAALFCGVATQGGRAGFMFQIDPSCFGGKNAWNACVKRIPQDLISRLTNLGFLNQNKGKFFLPVLLNNHLLAKSWIEYGEFTADDDSFEPLRQALEKLKQAVPILDQIMQGCTSATAAQP